MKVLLHPVYFANCATYAVIAQQNVVWEVHDNYQKQTFRNRTYICTDRGRLMLNIPIQHVGGEQGRQKYNDVRIDNSYAWQRQHLKTLQTAYRTSPFFEFYEDELIPFFEKSHTFLLDMNLEIQDLIISLLGLDITIQKTNNYKVNPDNLKDARFMVNAKKELVWPQTNYVQVFEDRHGFVKNSSILDLLFNEGPNALAYLRSQELSMLNV